MKTRLLILWILCLLAGVGARAQFGSDIGAPALSTLAWDHISSYTHDEVINGTIGLTTDKRMYVWGRNMAYTIHSKSGISSINTISGPQYQFAPYFVPSPAGETIKKVRILTANPGTNVASTYFALSESGKLYAWGVNSGLLKNQWPAVTSVSVTDSTKAIRKPTLLTVLPEASFVDFAVSKKGAYWVAISATGKAYHIGDAGVTVSTNFTALANPTGADAATFKYTRVWVSDFGGANPMIYLKGNDGKIYYIGPYQFGYATGVPNIANYADINISYPGRTWSTSGDESIGNVLLIAPIEVPIPTGVDIVDMKISYTQSKKASIYAISAAGKGYLAGLWRTRGSSDISFANYTIAPLASVPPTADLIKLYVNPDSVYVLNRFTEIATPAGATKMLDVNFNTDDNNDATLAIFDNNKAYWSGRNNGFTQKAFWAGDYLSIEQKDTPLVEECQNIGYIGSNSFYSWTYEAINYRGAAQLERVESGSTFQDIFIISKTRRGYFVGRMAAHSGIGKLPQGSYNGYILFPTPIANEQLLNCQTSPGTGGPLTAGPVTPTNTAVGTIDCSKTQIAPAPVAGVPSQTTLIVSVNVTTAGTFTPITVSGSGMSLGNGVSSVSTTTTGVQTFYIPLQYDGSALSNAFQFTVGSAGSCTADLTQKPNQQVTNVWSLTNCSAITPGTLSK